MNYSKRVIKGCEPLASDSSDMDSDSDPSETKINKDAAWFPMEDVENDSLEDSDDDEDNAVYDGEIFQKQQQVVYGYRINF